MKLLKNNRTIGIWKLNIKIDNIRIIDGFMIGKLINGNFACWSLENIDLFALTENINKIHP